MAPPQANRGTDAQENHRPPQLYLDAAPLRRYRESMGLTIGSLELAQTRIQGVTLRPLVGGYELIFGLSVTTRAEAPPVRRASIHGARITVKPDGGRGCLLGFARPEEPFEIIARPHQSSMSSGLYLPLQPGQIAALEALRGTGDLVD